MFTILTRLPVSSKLPNHQRSLNTMTEYIATTPDNLGEVPRFTMQHCFEVDFLVAREIPGRFYIDSDDSDSDEYRQPKWTAAPNFGVKDAVTQCARILRQSYEAVIVHNSSQELDEMGPAPEDVYSSWQLCPSPVACPLEGAPPEFDWLPVRLRVPFQRESLSRAATHSVRWAMGALRGGIVMHVNSTCVQRIIVKLEPEPMSMLIAKRLITQICVTEFPLFRFISPHMPTQGVMDRSKAYLDSFEEHQARLIPYEVSCHPCLPLHMRLSVTQHALERIWNAKSMEELKVLISESDGSPLAFALDLLPGHDPMVSLRYGIWHPYRDQDLTVPWCLLARAHIVAAHQQHHTDWVELIAAMDAHAFFDNPDLEPWTRVLSIRAQRIFRALGYTSEQIMVWLSWLLQYEPDGNLSRERINSRGILPTIRAQLPPE